MATLFLPSVISFAWTLILGVSLLTAVVVGAMIGGDQAAKEGGAA